VEQNRWEELIRENLPITQKRLLGVVSHPSIQLGNKQRYEKQTVSDLVESRSAAEGGAIPRNFR
jgi:hypothetical protein